MCGSIAALSAAEASAESVWGSSTSGNWSTDANWLDGSAPVAGGDPALTLRFNNRGSAAVTATNDRPGVFVLNALELDNGSRTALTIAGSSGTSLKFAGAAPEIKMMGTGKSVITSDLILEPATGDLRITGRGVGDLTLSGSIAESGGARKLVIATTPSSANVQSLTLSAANSFTGGVELQSGNLTVGHSGALGTGTLTVNGGTLRLLNSSVALSNPIALNTDLVISAAGGGSINGVISSATSGTGLVLRDSATVLSLTSASTYSGATTLDYSLSARMAAAVPSTLVLSGNGSVLSSLAINIRAGATLRLDPATSGTINRIGDDTPIRLQGGVLRQQGAASGNSSPQVETVGQISGAGYSTVSVTSTASGTRLVSESLNRLDRGTFLFTGNNLGGTFGNATGNIVFTNAPTGLVGGNSGSATSILPYAIGDANPTGAGTSFVIYDPTTGVRPLTGYVARLFDATSTSNVRLTTTEFSSSPKLINSLVLGSGGSIEGPVTATITIASGAVLSTPQVVGNGTSIRPPLAFGTTEANFFTVGDLAVFGTISGSGGVTKSGAGRLILSANNTFTGPLTINAGAIAFSALSALGTDTSTILINGQGAGLAYTGSSNITLSRNIETRTGLSRIDGDLATLSPGTLTVTGVISGDGGLLVTHGTLALTAENTYTGPTRLINGANLQINSDAALGKGGAVNLGAGTLVMRGDWTTDREISVTTFATLDTSTFSATWNGILTGSGSLTKTGKGVLNLTSGSPFDGLISINGGGLRLSGGGAVQTTSISLNTGGTSLVLDNTDVPFDNRLSSSAGVTLRDGDFRIIGNPNSTVTERLSGITVASGTTGGSLTLLPAEKAGIRLQLNTSLAAGDGELTLRGANLGGASTGAYSRIVLNVAGPTGILRGVYADPDGTGMPAAFVIYDSTVDAAGTIGYRPLRAGDYTTGPTIQNLGNGGTTPGGVNFLLSSESPATTATGTVNTVGSLTFAGGNLSLSSGQQLNISTGQVLAQVSTEAASLNGGTLAFGDEIVRIYTDGEFALGSTITGSRGFRKMGAGTLTFTGSAAYTGATQVAAGTLRIGATEAFAQKTVSVLSLGTLDVPGEEVKVGALDGNGKVQIGGGTLTVGGLGNSFEFKGKVSGTGKLVIVDGGNASATRYFSGQSTFAGAVVLESGQLSLWPSALGTGPLIINGGTLGVRDPTEFTQPVQLNVDLQVVGNNSLTLRPAAVVSGKGGIVARNANGLTVQTMLDLPAGVRSAYVLPKEFDQTPSKITVSGPQGAIISSAGVTIRTGGSLLLDDSSGYTGTGNGRLGDTTPVYLSSGTLQLSPNRNSQTLEAFGALAGDGFSKVTVTSTGSPGASLTATSLERINRGTFGFSADSGTLGGTLGANVGQFKLVTPPTLVGGGGEGTDVSVVPWAVGTGSQSGLLTYDSNGFRLLTAAEYTPSLAESTPTSNVLLGGDATNNAPLSINALSLNYASIYGSGSLTIRSGVVLQSRDYSAPSIGNRLEFGAAEAQFFLPLNAYGSLVVTGVITGSGGLTKSGSGELRLSAANQFTGPLTINGGTLSFTSIESLGADTSPIVLTGADSTLRTLATGPVTLSRGIRLLGGVSALEVSDTNGTFVASDVSGPGGLRISGPGVVKLQGNNTYSGPTFVQGTLAIDSDNALGSSDLVCLTGNPSKLRLDGPWSSNCRIELLYLGTIDTNSFDGTVGQISGNSGTFVKTGAGRLVVTDASEFLGSTKIDGGNLVLNGRLGSSLETTVKAAGTLSGNLQTTGAVSISGTLAPGDTIGTMSTGSVTFSAGSTLVLELGSRISYDQLLVTGTVSLSGNTNLQISLAPGFNPVNYVDQFTIILNDGVDSIALGSNGRFSFGGSVLDEGARFVVDGQGFEISYKGGADNNDVVLYAVPEPQVATLLASGLLVMATRRRRR
ncbi:autotransporter-associated beta strand repeat-containing protein [Verrucomicrobiota bacterium sgz303538]